MKKSSQRPLFDTDSRFGPCVRLYSKEDRRRDAWKPRLADLLSVVVCFVAVLAALAGPGAIDPIRLLGAAKEALRPANIAYVGPKQAISQEIRAGGMSLGEPARDLISNVNRSNTTQQY